MKTCWDNRGPCPMSITIKRNNNNFRKFKHAWTIVDHAPCVSSELKNVSQKYFWVLDFVVRGPSVSNIFIECGILWFVPHEYHVNLKKCRFTIFLGSRFCGSWPMSIKYIFLVRDFVVRAPWVSSKILTFSESEDMLGQSWTVPHEYHVNIYQNQTFGRELTALDAIWWSLYL